MKISYHLILLVLLGSLLIIMGLLTNGSIFNTRSLQGMAFQLPLLGLFSIAQMVPMISGGIDLSIISCANLVGILSAFVLSKRGDLFSIIASCLLGIALAGSIGILNGTLIAFMSIPPIIATLGTMLLFKGIALVITKGYIISGLAERFLVLGNGTLFGIPIPLLVFLGIVIISWFILNRTKYGVTIYMFGSNPVATKFSGIDVKKLVLLTYMFSSLIAGLAGLVMIARFNAAQAAYGESYLLLTVLTCVLGGVSPSGGKGGVLGVVIAVVILQIVSTGFNLLKLSSHLANALWGIILVGVIVTNRTLTLKKE